jgi:predicted Zn finger-like uncharacterized protein
MTQLVTRCPQCSTSFRITPAQIQKARGAVRCGSCLHIFNAEQHLIEGSPRKPARAKASKVAKPRPPQTPRPVQAHLAIETHEQAPTAAPAPQTAQAQPAAKATAVTAPRRAASQAAPGPSANPSNTGNDSLLRFDQAQIDRESAQDDILISDDMDHDRSQADENELYLAPSEPSHSLFERKIAPEQDPFVDNSDESWAEHLLEEDQPTPPPRTSEFDSPLSITHTEAEQAPQPAPAAEEPPSKAAHTAAPPEPPSAEPESEPEPAPEPEPLRAQRAESEAPAAEPERLRAHFSDRSELLLGIDPEPVEMTGAYHRPWGKRLLWGSLSLLAVIVLAAQISWLQFDRFSRISPYRGYYQSACQWLGCQLPVLRDTSQIRTFNLVVRQHPEHAQALVVDAIILNSADFKQPFPHLRLSFSDMRDRPVASRTFTPAEYLRGELAGRRIMPINQPVHLSIELSDPGAAAVNYRLDIP